MPNSVPFLQNIFATIGEIEVHNELFNHAAHELVSELAAAADVEILARSNQHSSHKDPLSYLHEKFLEQYNPQLRELRGVYYTPDPVVSYIVRSIDFLLRTHFNRQNGLAEISEDMLLLDPACGTGIFLQAVIDHIRNEFKKTSDPEKWRDYVHLNLLPHLFGFELLAAPYVIAHLKLAIQLAALDLSESERQMWAYRFQHNEQPNIYLTNTLELIWRGQAPPLQYTNREEHLSEYSRGGACPRPRLDIPRPDSTNQILVILGNPPF